MLAIALLVSGCGNSSTSSTETGEAKSTTAATEAAATEAAETKPAESGESGSGMVSLENCGKTMEYPKPTEKLFANDGNIISIALAAGASDNLVAVSSLQRDKDILALKYGDVVDKLKVVAPKYPSLENIVAADPQVVFAGWGYGFSESKGLTPDTLKEKNIKTYLLSETCKQADGNRGTMPPWEALTHDITSIGAMTGHEEEAKAAVADIETRKKALEAAPKADKEPVAFLFDSASDTIFSSGSFGAPQAMMESAGVKNALSDVKDTWTKVSWERLASSDPDIIFFVDYPSQTYDEKVAALKA
ncbi:MAG: iron transporter, partial [Propionibacterium sp.]